jgi:hypothetical protein
MSLKIDPEFRDLIPPLSNVELKQLHDNISNQGCLNPLIAWKEEFVLLDGHNRFAFCSNHEIVYEVKQLSFLSRDAAKDWIILNQLGRRNVSPDTAARLRGQLYLSRKKSVGEHFGNQHTNLESRQNGGIPKRQQNTAESVAKETGVSPRTIERDAKYAEACDKLGITTAAIASGEENRSRKEIIETAFPEKAKSKPIEIVQDHANHIFETAKSVMDRIAKNDVHRVEALNSMVKYCENRIQQNK